MRDDETCAVCGRSILAGERPRAYLTAKAGERLVCELCRAEAERRGWSEADAQPPEPEPAPEPPAQRVDAVDPARVGADAVGPAGLDPEAGERADPAAPGANVGRRVEPDQAESPRMRLERAAARFNGSEAARTVSGLMRTLGRPWVSIGAAAGSPSQVRVTVAWELGWYQWGVDLDEPGSVRQLDKGKEIDELDGSARQWNATADPGGRLELGAPENGQAPDAERVR